MNAELPQSLAERLQRPLPGRVAQSRFEPQYSDGRHFATPPANAKPAAVLVLIYPHNGAWHFPLTVRPDTLPDHPGQISLPGGMIEPGEDSQTAALRELHEELGVPSDSIRVLGRLSPLYLFVSNFHVNAWVAALEERPEIEPNASEVAELLEVPLAHLLDPASVSSHDLHHDQLHFQAPHIEWQSHRIWGATGMLLGELTAILEELDV